MAAVYKHLADNYPEKETRHSFDGIIVMEKTHVDFWSAFLLSHQAQAVKLSPGRLRLALYKLMFRILGKSLTLRILEISENQAVELYSSMLDDALLSDEERHKLGKVLEDEFVHEKLLVNEETKYDGFIAYTKDAVLGLSDGLVEILSVTTGLAGASGRCWLP